MHKLVSSSVLAGLLAFAVQAGAADSKALRFYEDALARYDKNDMPGAIIQLKNVLQQDKQMLAAHILLGKALLSEGDPVGAEVEFEEALRLGVNRAEVAVPLARAYLQQGKFDALLDRIVPSGLPKELQVDILILRGNALAEKGSQAAAIRSLDEAQTVDPRSVQVRLAKSAILIRSGAIDQAAAQVDEAMKLAPNDASVWDARASVLHLKGDLQGALSAYAKSVSIDPRNLDTRFARAGLMLDLDRLDEADREVADIQRLSPQEPRGAYLRAVIAGRKGDAATVRASLSEVVKLLDPVPSSTLNRHKQMLLLAALAHHGLGNREKARERLSTYVRQFPREPGASKLLASLYIEAGENVSAISLLEPLQKANPDDPRLLSLLASAHMAMRHYSQATALLEQAVKASGGAADIRADFGLSLISEGQTDLGINQLQQSFAKDPGQPRAGIVLAAAYLRKNQPKKALEVIEAVVKRDPDNLTALNFLGLVRKAAGDAAGSRKAYEQALSRDERFHIAALNLARLDVSEGKPDAARSRLARILKIDANNADAMFEMALLEERAGNFQEAVRWLEKARAFPTGFLRAGLYLTELHMHRRSFEQALAVAKETASKAPENLVALAAVSRVQIALGDNRGARQTLADMTRYANYDAAAQVEVARLQLAAGNDAGAAYSLEKALGGNPEFLPALVMQAELDIARRDYAKAEQRIRLIGQKSTGQVPAARLQGDLAVTRGQYGNAIASYRSALAKEASSDTALRICRAHFLAGDGEKGIKFLEGWHREHPNDMVIERAVADGYLRIGNLSAARGAYERFLQRQPEDADVLNNLAQTMLKQGDSGALDIAQKAVRIAGNDAGVIDTLGWVLVKQGQTERGLGYLRDARLRNPANAEIRYHLAVALAKTGRQSEAREELAQALKDPGSSFEGLEDAKKLQREMSRP